MSEFLSLGGGVQSITLCMLAAHGVVGPMPKAAIFADTHWEPDYVYDQLAWVEKQIPFPVVRVSAGSVRQELLENPDITVPAFMEGGGKLRRQCTGDFKIVPIRREVRKQLGMKPRGRPPKGLMAKMWIGISLDEKQRQKQSWAKFIENRHPLIELGMSRTDCEDWMGAQGYPVPRKSSCIGCPFHGDDFWLEMKQERPGEFADAVVVDRELRVSDRVLNEQAFLHRNCQPLDQVTFKNAPALTMDECAGVCGI